MDSRTILETQKLRAGFVSKSGPRSTHKNEVVKGIDLRFEANTITAIIGPSGCGKSTYIRCLNRLHEEVPGSYAYGRILLDSKVVYENIENQRSRSQSDPVDIRRQVGMVFQKPNPFPSLSVFENVCIGLKLSGIRKSSILKEVVERSLKEAALWDEVKDKLHAAATSLSGGQQQRLCIARTLAVEPRVLLMDEPTSALDPLSTAKIEELVTELKKHITIVMVTHNMQQAARVSDRTAFFLMGEMVEFGDTSRVFTAPKDERTERYITGRFG